MPDVGLDGSRTALESSAQTSPSPRRPARETSIQACEEKNTLFKSLREARYRFVLGFEVCRSLKVPTLVGPLVVMYVGIWHLQKTSAEHMLEDCFQRLCGNAAQHHRR